MEENVQRDKNLGKKREFFREREKSLMKKRIFSRETFSRENSLFNFLSISNASFTYSNSSKSSNTSNPSIFTFLYFSLGKFWQKIEKRIFFWKRDFSLEKISPEKNSLLLRFFSFSLPLTMCSLIDVVTITNFFSDCH